jgi:hypothetical protein
LICYSQYFNKNAYNETWAMDIPGAIRSLNKLKLKDQTIVEVCNQCVKKLEYTMKTAERPEIQVEDAP